MITSRRRIVQLPATLFALLVLAACGGGYGGDSGGSAYYYVSGTVSGLIGSGLVLRDNGSDDLPASASGMFTFTTHIQNGSTYNVTVYAQPSGPAQTCTVTNGSGTMGHGNVTNVAVNCTVYFSAGSVNGHFVGVSYDSPYDTGALQTAIYDGAGNLSGSGVSNVAGNIAAIAAFTGTYAVAADGAMTSTGAGVTTDGGVSADGRTLISAQLTAGQVPDFSVAIVPAYPYFALDSFSGTYRIVAYDNAGMRGGILTLTADGSGTLSGTQVVNDAGTISTSAVSGTYTAVAGGTLTVTLNSGPPLTGYVSDVAHGTNTLILSSVTAGNSPSTLVGVRQDHTAFSNASLMGTYRSIAYDGSSNKVALLTLVADGAGNITGTQILNSAGVVSSSSVTATYSVAGDGTLTIANGANLPITAYLSNDGGTFVQADANPGDLPSIGVGIRQ
jgi:hypothetical protein